MGLRVYFRLYKANESFLCKQISLTSVPVSKIHPNLNRPKSQGNRICREIRPTYALIWSGLE